MKSVIRSAKPYWIYLILTGKKTVEVGKNFPKFEDWNKIVEMYCSKDMRSFNRIPKEDRAWMRKYLGKVACRFVCDAIYKIEPHNDGYGVNQYVCDWKYNWKHDKSDDCLGFKELHAYLNGKVGYGWHISDLVIYDKPRELDSFRVGKVAVPCGYGNYNIYDKVLTRPPMSWCYVEV